jgi:hypothetical protein
MSQIGSPTGGPTPTPMLDGVASMMVSHYSKREAWSHRSVFDKHENSNKENPRNKEPHAFIWLNTECDWIRLNMQIVRVAHFSLITHVDERQLCIVNRGCPILVTKKQQWGVRMNKFRSTVRAPRERKWGTKMNFILQFVGLYLEAMKKTRVDGGKRGLAISKT